MATNKKSVLLYCDLIHTVEKMDNETAGQFFKHYLRYINDLNPKTDNLVVDISFEAVKQNLKRDLKKWEVRAESSRSNGKKGGRPKEPSKPSGLINNLDKPNKPVTVTVTDTVTDNVKVKVINKVKNSDSIEQRKLKFADTLKPFIDKYGKELIKDFYLYWTEPNKSNTRFKQELLKTWSAERRLSNWNKNDFNKTNNGNKQLTATEKNQRDSDESTKRLLERVQQDFDNQQGI